MMKMARLMPRTMPTDKCHGRLFFVDFSLFVVDKCRGRLFTYDFYK